MSVNVPKPVPRGAAEAAKLVAAQKVEHDGVVSGAVGELASCADSVVDACKPIYPVYAEAEGEDRLSDFGGGTKDPFGKPATA